jgi:hypothetical protein
MAEGQTPDCGCAPQNCASRRASRTSTIAPSAVWTASCSRSSRRVNGSTPTTTSLWSAHPASARAGTIGQKACRDNRSVLCHRWPKLCEDLALARGDGRHPRLIKSLGRADLLILDDFGLEPLDAGARHDLLEILEERYGRRSTIVTSQLPLSAWHEVVGDPTTPTPSWTASSTTRIASNSPAKACAEPKANSQRRLDPKPRKGRELS